MMDAETLAALERLIARIKADPPAKLAYVLSFLSPETIAKAERDARAVALSGLTYAQAVKVRDVLDTPDERADAGNYIPASFPESDRVILLQWLLGDVLRALATPTAPEVQSHAGGAVAPQPGPILHLPATCGWYADRENLTATIAAVAKLAREAGIPGKIGLDIEGTGDLGNPGADSAGLLAKIEERFAYIADTLVPACVAAGVPLKITGGNTNDFGKGFKGAWKDTDASRAWYIRSHKALAMELVPYSQWVIAQALAEKDYSMAADFRRQTQAAWLAAGFPASRMSAEDREGGAALDEAHASGAVATYNGGARDFVSTDNGGGIAAHFSGGGTWTASVPRVDACIRSAKAILARGTSFSLYHRATRLAIVNNLDAYRQIVQAVAPILQKTLAGGAPNGGDPSPLIDVSASPGLTFRYICGGMRDVAWSPAVDRSGWPSKGVDSAACDGLLYGARVGEPLRKIEWIKRGEQSAHTRNAWAYRIDPKYNQHLVGGERMRFEIRDIDGKPRGGFAGECVLG